MIGVFLVTGANGDGLTAVCFVADAGGDEITRVCLAPETGVGASERCDGILAASVSGERGATRLGVDSDRIGLRGWASFLSTPSD